MSESIPENDVIISKNVKDSTYRTADAAYAAAADSPNDRRNKKKSGAFGIFKVALFMMRKRRGDKLGGKPVLAKQDSTPANNTNNANWTKLVGSVRPLHLQETSQSPPPQIAAAAISGEIREMIPPASPSAASTSSGTMSKYASAASLLDLDNSSDEEEEDPDEVFDALTGDEMIDAKAEKFIAQFYKQIQLQKTARTHRHHHS
ncbi:hypothetical protein OROGR_024876 [Orobanche gracilis]